MDRDRLLDMEQHLAPVRHLAMGIIAVGLLISAPWIGWWTLAPLGIAAVLFLAADASIHKAKRPEYAMFAAWAGSEVMIAGAAALSGGPKSPAMMLFAVPVVTLSARFSLRGVIAGVVTALALLLAVAFGVNAAAVIEDPTFVLAAVILVICVAVLSTALMDSDVQHRSEAVLDQLTGMLNRNALSNRAVELAQQSQITGQPIGLILGDIDHFKEINDTHGHAIGDGVLKDVSYLLRKHLRAFDLAYRIGGEEFLVLLPGADREQTAVIAEDLCQAIAASTYCGGLPVSMSFGVSASFQGTPFDYEAVFAEADAGLYEAKRAGRNRVCDVTGSNPLSSHLPVPSLAAQSQA